MIYRLISVKSKNIYYVQTSFRLFFKSSKPDSIGANHRILTEVDGESLLEKRNNIKSKFLSFDDTLLQSPRIFQQPINLSVPPIPTTTLNNNSPKLAKNILLIKENNKNKSNSIEGISNYEKLKKKLTTTTSKKYKKHNKDKNEESKIVKKLISKEVEKSGEEEESSSFLNENVNKAIIYREDLNVNLVEDNSNNNVNQHLDIPTTTTTNIYYNNNLNEDVSSAMLSTFPYYYYYCCISPNQQQNLFGSLIMDLTNNEGGGEYLNNNCIIPDYWTSAVMAAVVDINNEDNNNEMLNNQAIPLPLLQPPLDSDLASSIFHWPQIFPQNSKDFEIKIIRVRE
ncbi:unnamed protein product [Meloidogyne enterolobii]|uniref:Uncharacterized protein n=1 Tax=Meloidogyne enterolobii TaxID=390850 RepID=A0ACB0YM64_MELEN